MDDEIETPRPILKKRKIKDKKKTVLIFDEAARKEYLTGFHKRKNERRKKAKEENTKKVKEERQALRQQVREMIQRSDQYRVPEVEHLLDSTVYDLPEHTVTVTDVSEIDLSNRHGTSKSDLAADQQGPSKDGKATEEDASALQRKKKKLKHKLAAVGNPVSNKKKVKRLGKGKFKGGGRGGKGKFTHNDRSKPQGGGKKMNHKSGNKKHRHK